MDSPASLPFLAMLGACALPFALRGVARTVLERRPRKIQLRGLGWFVGGTGFGMLAMAYAIATELPWEWAETLRKACVPIAIVAAVLAYALTDPPSTGGQRTPKPSSQRSVSRAPAIIQLRLVRPKVCRETDRFGNTWATIGA